MPCDLEVTNAHYWEEISSYITIAFDCPKVANDKNLASSPGTQFILTQMQCVQMADFRKFLITIFRVSVQKTFRITTEKNVHLDENRENISGTSGLGQA